MDMQKTTKHRLIILAGITLVVLGLLGAVALDHMQSRAKANSVKQTILSLVSVGMSEEELVSALKSANIQFGEKYKPTDGDYFLIYISTGASISIAGTIEYTVTGSGRFTGGSSAVVVTLDEQGIITSID
jgi:hypothetical protein